MTADPEGAAAPTAAPAARPGGAAPDTRPLLLIVSSEIEPTDTPGRLRAPWGVQRLMAAGEDHGFRVIATHVGRLTVEVPRGGRAPRVLLEGREIRPAAAVIRSMRGAVVMTRALDAALRMRGCILLDPPERLALAPLGKGELVLRAQGSGHDQDRRLVGDRAELLRILTAYDYARGGKLVVKPMEGFGGSDVRWVDGSPASIDAAVAMAARGPSAIVPVIVERALDIVAEYRVYTLDGEVLGSVRRVPKGPEMPANAKQGATYLTEDPPEAGFAAMRRLMVGGLVGWDLAFLRTGEVIVIETNRPPVWRIFTQTTGIDIAQNCAARLRRRLEEAQAAAAAPRP